LLRRAATRRAFALLSTGVRLLGTLHARSAAEAVQVMCEAAELARTDVFTPFVFAIISAHRSGHAAAEVRSGIGVHVAALTARV
jgi:hypothetical protein